MKFCSYESGVSRAPSKTTIIMLSNVDIYYASKEKRKKRRVYDNLETIDETAEIPIRIHSSRRHLLRNQVKQAIVYKNSGSVGFCLIKMVDVNSIQSGTVFAWFMLIMVVRRVAMLVVAGFARRGKPFLPGSRVPEDSKLRGGQVDVSPVGIDHNEFAKDVRVNKTINNDSENDTYFLILILATAAFSDSVSRNATRTIVYGAIYLFARLFYAVAYIMALQPWRSLLFALGLACTLACSLDLVITMSRRSN